MNWFRVGAFVMALTVLLGAFGAHGLESHFDEKTKAWWETAIRYQAWHGIGLLCLGTYFGPSGSVGSIRVAAWLLLVGIIIFSGTLYIMALGGPSWLGALTPIGGTAWLVAWCILGATAFSSDRS